MKYHLRPYTFSDAQAVVEVINAASLRAPGFRRATVDAVGNIWAFKFIPFNSEKVIAVTEQNQIVGYAYFTDDKIVTEMGVAVHPDHWDQGIGSALIEWAEAHAIAASQNATTGIKIVLQTSLFDTELDAQKLFKEHGFSPVREWMHLAFEMKEPPVIPALPANLSLREMDLDSDWEIVSPAMDEAFADHWGNIPEGSFEVLEQEQANPESEAVTERPSDYSFSNAPGYCFIVLDGETVAGGILCNAKLVERSDTGRVGSIFVCPAYRKCGIARVLMLTAFDAFWKNGFRRVITDTDANSFTDSTKLYKGLGMKPYRNEFTYEKEIRAGREVRRLEV